MLSSVQLCWKTVVQGMRLTFIIRNLFSTNIFKCLIKYNLIFCDCDCHLGYILLWLWRISGSMHYQQDQSYNFVNFWCTSKHCSWCKSNPNDSVFLVDSNWWKIKRTWLYLSGKTRNYEQISSITMRVWHSCVQHLVDNLKNKIKAISCPQFLN